MPVMDGYESCRAVREFEKNQACRTAIVALTANAMASDELKCLGAGMDAFLTKPIDQEYMVQIILRTVTSQGNSSSSLKSSSVTTTITEASGNSSQKSSSGTTTAEMTMMLVEPQQGS